MPVSSRRRSTVLSKFPAIALLEFALALVGCGDSGPSRRRRPVPCPSRRQRRPPPERELTVFTDAATGFLTTDLRDVQEQIVQLSSIGELIWTADGTRLPGYRVTHPTADGKLFFIEGKICPEQCAFEVRFGTRDGERRAYLTVDSTPTGTGHPRRRRGRWWRAGRDGRRTEYPPGSPTLSGAVSEMTPELRAPVEGAEVWRSAGPGWRPATTDKNGLYRIQGLYDGAEIVVTRKEGYLRHAGRSDDPRRHAP